jgi:hypothetical protein
VDEAVGIARRLGSPYHLAAALVNLADLARMRDDAPDAARHCREGLLLFAGIGERAGVAVCLRLLGWVAWAEGRSAPAARLFGAADALCPVAIGPDRAAEATYGRVCANLAERLGEDAYASGFEAGRGLTFEAAVAEAGAER